MTEKTDSEHKKVWDNVQISEEKQPEIVQGPQQLPPELDRAAKLLEISRQYMETVISELDLDREQFYEGVGMGINMLLNTTANLIREQKKPPQE